VRRNWLTVACVVFLAALVGYSEAEDTKEVEKAPKITGIVRDEAGKAVEGAFIRTCPMRRQDVLSDASGKYEIIWDPKTSGLEDFERFYYLVARHEERNLAAAVEIKKDTRKLDIRLAPGVILAGQVVDTDGKAIADAQIVVALQVSHWGTRWSTVISDLQRTGATTNAEGRFEVKAIPPVKHRYYLTVKAEGYGQHRIEISAEEASYDLDKVPEERISNRV